MYLVFSDLGKCSLIINRIVSAAKKETSFCFDINRCNQLLSKFD